MDVNLTYSELLKGFKKPRYLKDYEPSSSAIVFYWNIDRSFKELDLHNIIFSKNNSEEFDYIFNFLNHLALLRTVLDPCQVQQLLVLHQLVLRIYLALQVYWL